ncbi:MAG: hypothetical protein JWQ90_3868 [Hydrocarboniphaga sp.]|uniref:nuclear transport factor 2 family protein n=1 Tax=Hydrocarboniphaga sp. TaxID=2033016 RepID=UPI00262F0A67|nr:nuclear transport factor 2 family protein [Hydrocarboniphaga sp.]MDB5971418.1 hypothetical protein [Hydrocarboniphaga sp.]
MLKLQEISDRLEIQQLMTDYASAIDRRRFDELDRVFTPDAYIDYRAMGGIDGRFPQVKAWLSQVLPAVFVSYLHMNGNLSIQLDGDRATSRMICFNPMVMDVPGKGRHTMFVGLWYDDALVRTADGWRISERREEKCFDHNLPEGFGAPEIDSAG